MLHKIHSESQNTPPHFVQYLISYIAALLALTQQAQQYRRSTFPESADHIPLSVSREGSVRATKAECEKKKKKKTLWRLHYLQAPQPVSEARVNCCWLDVSTHGWVSHRGGATEGEEGEDEVAHRQWCGINVKCSSSVGLAAQEADKERRRGNTEMHFICRNEQLFEQFRFKSRRKTVTIVIK